MGYKKVGEIMKNTNTKTRDNVYQTAVDNSDICFGNHDNVDPCDPKFSRQGVPHPVCLKRKFLEEGGDPKGSGYKKDFSRCKWSKTTCWRSIKIQ